MSCTSSGKVYFMSLLWQLQQRSMFDNLYTGQLWGEWTLSSCQFYFVLNEKFFVFKEGMDSSL